MDFCREWKEMGYKTIPFNGFENYAPDCLDLVIFHDDLEKFKTYCSILLATKNL
jgi:hypothetical protein